MGYVKFGAWFLRLAFFLGMPMLLEASGIAASVNPRALTPRPKARGLPRISTRRSACERWHAAGLHARVMPLIAAVVITERFHTSSFSSDITEGDVTAGEDPVVRQAAIDALGNMNGTVVAIEPTSGRVLAMVNQKLALSGGAQPCSTIKLSVALAALSEGVIDSETEVPLGRRSRMNLTEALAHSNNAYFEAVGRKLGFEKFNTTRTVRTR